MRTHIAPRRPLSVVAHATTPGAAAPRRRAFVSLWPITGATYGKATSTRRVMGVSVLAGTAPYALTPSVTKRRAGLCRPAWCSTTSAATERASTPITLSRSLQARTRAAEKARPRSMRGRRIASLGTSYQATTYTPTAPAGGVAACATANDGASAPSRIEAAQRQLDLFRDAEAVA